MYFLWWITFSVFVDEGFPSRSRWGDFIEVLKIQGNLQQINEAQCTSKCGGPFEWKDMHTQNIATLGRLG